MIANQTPSIVAVTSSGSQGLQVSFGGITPLVTSSVFVSNTVSVVNGTGNLRVNGPNAQGIATNTSPVQVGGLVTGSIVQTSAIDAQGVWFVNISTGSLGQVRTWDGGTQGISGSVALTNWPLTMNVSASAGISLNNWPLTLNVSASSGIAISNWPATINVSASAGVAISNWPATLGVSSSGASPVFVATTGSLGVGINSWATNLTGSVTVAPGTDRATNGVITTASLGSQGAPAGSFVVIPTLAASSVGIFLTGSWTAASGILVAFEGTVDELNWFGIYGTPPLTGSAVTSTTTPGYWTVPAAGLVQVRAHAQTWAANITGTFFLESTIGDGDNVIITNPTTMPIPIGVTGSTGLMVSFGGIAPIITSSVFVSNQVAVVPGSTLLRTWDGGIQSVSGSQLTGSTFSGFPVVMGGVWQSGAGGAGAPADYVTAMQTDVSGNLGITTLGSASITVQPFNGAMTVTPGALANFRVTIQNIDLTGSTVVLPVGAGAALTGSVYTQNQTNYNNIAQAAAGITNFGTIDTASAATIAFQWYAWVTGGVGVANNFTGSMGVQGSNDNTIWVDVSRQSLLVGRYNNNIVDNASGSYGNSAFFRYYRMSLAAGVITGLGAAVSSSFTLKG